MSSRAAKKRSPARPKRMYTMLAIAKGRAHIEHTLEMAARRIAFQYQTFTITKAELDAARPLAAEMGRAP